MTASDLSSVRDMPGLDAAIGAGAPSWTWLLRPVPGTGGGIEGGGGDTRSCVAGGIHVGGGGGTSRDTSQV